MLLILLGCINNVPVQSCPKSFFWLTCNLSIFHRCIYTFSHKYHTLLHCLYSQYPWNIYEVTIMKNNSKWEHYCKCCCTLHQIGLAMLRIILHIVTNVSHYSFFDRLTGHSIRRNLTLNSFNNVIKMKLAIFFY